MNILDDDGLEAALKRLSLANSRRLYKELIQRAEEEQWSYRAFLSVLLQEEISHRHQTRMHKLT